MKPNVLTIGRLALLAPANHHAKPGIPDGRGHSRALWVV